MKSIMCSYHKQAFQMEEICKKSICNWYDVKSSGKIK